MKLQNQKRHMIGMAVLCDGTTYQIDQFGVANVTDAAHAKKLLTMDDWRVAKGEAQKAPEKLAKPEPKAEPQGEPSEEPQEAGTDAQGDPEGANAGEEPQASGEGQPGFATQEEADAAKAVEPVEVPPPAANADGTDPGTEDPNAWPDPDMNMSKAYLQEMADAYEVKYEDKTTKQELVDTVREKMYD